MKKLIYILSIALVFAIVLSGCEETEFAKTEDTLGRFVAFESTSISLAESTTTNTTDGTSTKSGNAAVVTVYRSSSDLSGDLSVSISADITFASSSDFAEAGDDASSTVIISEDLSALTIPAGEASKSFTISSIDDDFSSGDKIVAMEITGTSDAEFGIGAQNIGGSATLTVVDDDCPIDLASFEGTYSMTVVGTPGQAFDGFDLCASAARDCSGDVTLSADPSDPVGQTAILTHPSFGGEYKIQFVTCPKEVLVVQPMTSFFGVGAWQMQQGTSGLGTYNDDSKAISIIGVLGTNGDFTISLTKN